MFLFFSSESEQCCRTSLRFSAVFDASLSVVALLH